MRLLIKGPKVKTRDWEYLQQIIVESLGSEEGEKLQTYYKVEAPKLLGKITTDLKKLDLACIAYFLCDFEIAYTNENNIVKKCWNEQLVVFLLNKEVSIDELNIIFVLIVVHLCFYLRTHFFIR